MQKQSTQNYQAWLIIPGLHHPDMCHFANNKVVLNNLPFSWDLRLFLQTCCCSTCPESWLLWSGGARPHTAVGPPSISLVGRGNIGIALQISNFVGEDTWIVNSGTFDHMTYDRSYFTHLSSSIVSSVTNANGEAFPVLGIGSVQLTPSLTLHNMLYVPALSHHLISVLQLNSQSKCSVIFFPMDVVF